MNDITRADIDAAITKLHCVWVLMDDIRDNPAIWLDMDTLQDLEGIRTRIEELQLKLDNSY